MDKDPSKITNYTILQRQKEYAQKRAHSADKNAKDVRISDYVVHDLYFSFDNLCL